MLKIFVISILLAPAAAAAAELESLKASDIASAVMEAPLPVPFGVEGDRYSDGMIQGYHLMALTGQKMLYTQMADTRAKFEEFKAMWTPVIIKAGLKPAPAEYSPAFGALKYESSDGSAIRSFLCDTAHMPLSEADMEGKLSAALKAEGMTVVGSFGLPVDPDTFPKPTVNLYYLTAYNGNPDHEIQLRYLRLRNDSVKLDHTVLERAGIKIAASYGVNSVFYIGRRLGVIASTADSMEAAGKQAEYYKKMIGARGEELIAVKTDKLPRPAAGGGAQYSYLTKVYYFK